MSASTDTQEVELVARLLGWHPLQVERADNWVAAGAVLEKLVEIGVEPLLEYSGHLSDPAGTPIYEAIGLIGDDSIAVHEPSWTAAILGLGAEVQKQRELGYVTTSDVHT